MLVVFGPAEYTHRVDHQRGQPHGAAAAPERAVARSGSEARAKLQRELGGAADRVVAEEDVDVVAGREERLDPRGPRVELRPRRSRGGAGAGTGTSPFGG